MSLAVLGSEVGELAGREPGGLVERAEEDELAAPGRKLAAAEAVPPVWRERAAVVALHNRSDGERASQVRVFIIARVHKARTGADAALEPEGTRSGASPNAPLLRRAACDSFQCGNHMLFGNRAGADIA